MRDYSAFAISKKLVKVPFEGGLLARRLLVLALGLLEPSESDLRARVPVRYFERTFDLKLVDPHEELKHVARGVASGTVGFTTADETCGYKIVRSVSYRPTPTGDGVFAFEFQDQLRSGILEWGATYDYNAIRQIANLQSFHAVRLFEILMHLNRLGDREITLSLGELREALGIEYPKGTRLRRVEEYKDPSEFIDCVIAPAQQELRSKTSLDFTFTYNPGDATCPSLEITVRGKRPT